MQGQASPSDAERARALFDEGLSLSEAARWSEADAAFEASYALYPRARTLFNRVVALDRLGEGERCLAQVEALLQSADLREDDRREAERVADTWRPRLARVILQLTPANARVQLNGEVRTGSAWWLTPGSFVVRAEAEGFDAFEQAFDARAGETHRLSLRLSARVEVEVPRLALVSTTGGVVRVGPATSLGGGRFVVSGHQLAGADRAVLVRQSEAGARALSAYAAIDGHDGPLAVVAGPQAATYPLGACPCPAAQVLQDGEMRSLVDAPYVQAAPIFAGNQLVGFMADEGAPPYPIPDAPAYAQEAPTAVDDLILESAQLAAPPIAAERLLRLRAASQEETWRRLWHAESTSLLALLGEQRMHGSAQYAEVQALRDGFAPRAAQDEPVQDAPMPARAQFAAELALSVGLLRLGDAGKSGFVTLIEPLLLFGNWGHRVHLDIALGFDGWLGYAGATAFGAMAWPGLSLSTGDDEAAFFVRAHYGAGVARAGRTFGVYRAFRVSIGFRIGDLGTDVSYRQFFDDESVSLVTAGLSYRF